MTNVADNPARPDAEASAAAAAAPAEEALTGPIEVAIATCSVCDGLFLMSSRRETSPCHGADLGVVVATLTIAPNGDVIGHWGMARGLSEEEEEELRSPPAEEPPPPPAGDGEEEEEEEENDNLGVLLAGIGAYLADAGVAADDIHTWLTRMGADREDASAAVGRLVAVRDLLQRLEPPRGPAPVAPAPSEDEKTPATSPETPLTSDTGGV
jgi:hypothetical protein